MGSVIALNDTFIGGIDFVWARIGGSKTLETATACSTAGKTSLTLNQGFITAFGGVRVPLQHTQPFSIRHSRRPHEA